MAYFQRVNWHLAPSLFAFADGWLLAGLLLCAVAANGSRNVGKPVGTTGSALHGPAGKRLLPFILNF